MYACEVCKQYPEDLFATRRAAFAFKKDHIPVEANWPDHFFRLFQSLDAPSEAERMESETVPQPQEAESDQDENEEERIQGDRLIVDESGRFPCYLTGLSRLLCSRIVSFRLSYVNSGRKEQVRIWLFPLCSLPLIHLPLNGILLRL